MLRWFPWSCAWCRQSQNRNAYRDKDGLHVLWLEADCGLSICARNTGVSNAVHQNQSKAYWRQWEYPLSYFSWSPWLSACEFPCHPYREEWFRLSAVCILICNPLPVHPLHTNHRKVLSWWASADTSAILLGIHHKAALPVRWFHKWPYRLKYHLLVSCETLLSPS